MRKYSDKNNTQKKSYYTDRFRIPDEIKSYPIEDEILKSDLEYLSQSIDIQKAYMQFNQMIIWISSNDVFKTLEALKNNNYEVLTDLSAVDFIAKKGGFEIFYQMLSIKKCRRIRVKCFIQKHEKLQSVTSLYKSASWAERELYDMFGIIILNHPNLKRILMPEDWQGYPLLKTYPLQGDEAARWYEVDKIFGKEYREIIGEEQRDSAYVNEKDTFNFARMNHQVGYGMKPSDEKTSQNYQEESGVRFISKLDKQKAKILKKRP